MFLWLKNDVLIYLYMIKLLRIVNENFCYVVKLVMFRNLFILDEFVYVIFIWWYLNKV